MQKLARFLERAGYRVLNIDYPSTRYDLVALSAHIHPQIEAFLQEGDGKVHFVGYSMGGLLIRAYLHRYRPQQLGRVVMLGTPNKGSEVADFVGRWRLFRWLYGPAGQQLVTTPFLLRDIVGEIDFELGAIAGNRSLDPLGSWIIGSPNDGKVSLTSALPEEAAAGIVLPCTHTFFPANKRVWAECLNFLRFGHFSQ